VSHAVGERNRGTNRARGDIARVAAAGAKLIAAATSILISVFANNIVIA
jgi:hypothetical protein